MQDNFQKITNASKRGILDIFSLEEVFLSTHYLLCVRWLSLQAEYFLVATTLRLGEHQLTPREKALGALCM